MSKTYKVIVIGGTNVGKTCLVYRYTEKNYTEQENVKNNFKIIFYFFNILFYFIFIFNVDYRCFV